MFFVYFPNPFLKYLAKISFNRKMTQLVWSPWFNNIWMIFPSLLPGAPLAFLKTPFPFPFKRLPLRLKQRGPNNACSQGTSHFKNFVSSRNFHISHNAPYLRPAPPAHPQILHKLSFLLGITAVPREIKNNAYTNFVFSAEGEGANKMRYSKGRSGV